MAGLAQRMFMARMAKRGIRGVGGKVGGALNFGLGAAKNSARKLQAIKRSADGRRIRQATGEIELREFEERLIQQMSDKERTDSIRKLRVQISRLGVRGRTINKIVLERLSLYLLPALAEVKRQIQPLPPGLETKMMRNVMDSINISLRGNQVRLANANIPTIDGHIKQSIDEIIYKTLPEQHQ